MAHLVRNPSLYLLDGYVSRVSYEYFIIFRDNYDVRREWGRLIDFENNYYYYAG